MTSKQFLLIEPDYVYGHIRLNRFFLTKIRRHNLQLILLTDDLLAPSFQSLGLKIDRFKTKKYLAKKFKQRYFHLISTFFRYLEIAFYIYRSNSKAILFLSYEILFIPIPLLISKFCGKRVYLIEHNTVPDSWLKSQFQYVISQCFPVSRAAFAPYLLDCFKYNFNNKTLIHPILKDQRSSAPKSIPNFEFKRQYFDHTIFCPSTSTCRQFLEKSISINQNILYLTKKSANSNSFSNESSSSYYDYADYQYYMKACTAILLPLKTHLQRVSGPFYEALALNKLILMNKTRFSLYVLSLYPKNIVIVDQADILDPIINKNNHFNSIDFDTYNQRAIQSFEKFLGESID